MQVQGHAGGHCAQHVGRWHGAVSQDGVADQLRQVCLRHNVYLVFWRQHVRSNSDPHRGVFRANDSAALSAFHVGDWLGRFAPNATVPGTDTTLQDFLQEHYFNALAHLARKVRHIGCVRMLARPPSISPPPGNTCLHCAAVFFVAHRTVGYETMNEPSAGYIGAHVDELLEAQPLKMHESPTPFQAMALARWCLHQFSA